MYICEVFLQHNTIPSMVKLSCCWIRIFLNPDLNNLNIMRAWPSIDVVSVCMYLNLIDQYMWNDYALSFLIFMHERLQGGLLWWSEIGSREFQWIKLSGVAGTGVKIIAGNDRVDSIEKNGRGNALPISRWWWRRRRRKRKEEQNDGTWKRWRGWKERKKNKENRPRADLSKRQFRNYERNARERPADWNEIVSRFSSLTIVARQ